LLHNPASPLEGCITAIVGVLWQCHDDYAAGYQCAVVAVRIRDTLLMTMTYEDQVGIGANITEAVRRELANSGWQKMNWLI
jgi:hypothetical protein